MARSPAHLWGQIVGGAVESGVRPLLEESAAEHGLFLDRQGSRACRKGRKCKWIDVHGNAHDLDFVLERGGTANRTGKPTAFIEVAWRRYTKHSRNKAQEIQGAIMPLAETYGDSAPFKGAILAGEFTEGALTQLRSLGFAILHFPYEKIVEVFRRYGIDASSEEDTPDLDFQDKVNRYGRLSAPRRSELAGELIRSNSENVREFLGILKASVSRRIVRIIVLPLHGSAHELPSLTDAIVFVQRYDDVGARDPIQRYEIQIRYNNGDAIEGRFADKAGAVEFVRGYQ